jgi:hypothetical protein
MLQEKKVHSLSHTTLKDLLNELLKRVNSGPFQTMGPINPRHLCL